MLTYGDGVSNIYISELVEFHKSHGKIATLSAVRPPARFGSIIMNELGQINEFKEKPQVGEGWINGGYFVFNYDIFDYLQSETTILEREPLEKLAKDGELVAYRHEGFWHCMDTIRDKDNLNEIWASGNAPWKK
jgi:glucose-1-phosphate cytidylyltransferase